MGGGRQGPYQDGHWEESRAGFRAQDVNEWPDDLEPCRSCQQGGQIQRQVRLPRLVYIEDSRQTGHQGFTKEVFGKMVEVKAKPARTVVKAFPTAALIKSV